MGRSSQHILYHALYLQEAENYRNYLLLLGYARATYSSKYLYLKEFFNWLEETGIYQLHHITAVEIGNFYQYIQNRKSTAGKEPLKQKTVYDMMRNVQQYLGYALHLGKIKINPASHLKFHYPDEEVNRIIFSQEQIKELYQATENNQERAILHIAYGCGLRAKEVSRLNKEDIRLTENLIIVQKGKNSKRRLVPISDKIKTELEEFIFCSASSSKALGSTEKATQRNEKALFVNSKGNRIQQWTLNQLLKRMLLRTSFGSEFTREELNKISMHTLRHSIATHLLENGMKLEQVQLFLGHHHIESTEIYTHVSQSQVNSNLYHIKRFTDYYDKRAETATYKDVLHYIEYLRKNYDLHPKTLRNCLYAVKIYFNYLLETGKRNDHPCSELYLKDKVSRQIQVDNLYSPETLEHFFETYQIKRKTQLETRNKIIISLLIYQGLTVNEIAELDVKNINLDKGEIFIRDSKEITSKSPKSRTLPLQAKQILLFYKYLEKNRKTLLQYNKQNPNETAFILGQYGEKINPHGISKMINENRPQSGQLQPMKIRQSVIANLLKKENDTRIVQVFSGHKRASTTVQYKQTELEQLQNAINNFHPIK